MIIQPTTLILGAGASQPFGFPTGFELLSQVLDLTDVSKGKNEASAKWFDCLGHRRPNVEAFHEALLKSAKRSVDSFLEHRPEFIPLGKVAIALALISYEQEDALFKNDGNSWYQYLFNEISTAFDDFDKNKLRILTFNYDRSLERFLLTALRYSYNKTESECWDKLKSIPIIHLHGDLGGLPIISTEEVRPYNTEISIESLTIASNRIKIIHEGFDNAPQFAEAHKILENSINICFLGFGYHPLTLKRLRFESDDWNNSAKVSGSTYGLTQQEIRHTHTYFKGRLFNANNANATSSMVPVYQYLRETGLIQAASQPFTRG